jgi:hypothetical protein
VRWLLLICCVVACAPAPVPPGPLPDDAGQPDAGDKSATCASTFGTSLTPGFARLDGTVLAVLPPDDQACAKPNHTHLILQVLMNNDAYRMVVDVLSNQGNPDVFFTELDAPLQGPAWAEGWHNPASLDYGTNLQLHSTGFVEMNQAAVVAQLTKELELGARISVYATTTSAEPDSAHLVHRNLTNQDGAIVVHSDTAPHYLLIRFDEQTF